jgi:hypothetical protein
MHRANVAVLHVQPGGIHSNRWAVNVNMYTWQSTLYKTLVPETPNNDYVSDDPSRIQMRSQVSEGVWCQDSETISCKVT